MTKPHAYTIIIVALIALVGTVLYLSEFSLRSKANNVPKETFGAFDAGNYQESAERLRILVAAVPSQQARDELNLLLASSLYAQQDAAHVLEGVQLLKAIAVNPMSDPWIRASSLNNISTIVSFNTKTFYETNFTDKPFSEFLDSSKSESDQIKFAYRKILELSEDVYPNSFAEYALAGNYYAPLLTSAKIPATDREQTAQLMQTYVAQGDSHADSDNQRTSVSTIINKLLYRAIALNVSGGILKTPSIDEREKAFLYIFEMTDALERSGRPASSLLAQAALLRAHYAHADFLYANFGDKRSADIRSTLASFSAQTSQNPYLGYLGYIKTLPDASYTKKTALSLAKISPEFKSFLIASGVKVQ